MDLLSIFVAFAVIAVLLLLTTRRAPNLPPLVGKIPFIGCFPSFANNPIKTIRDAYDRFGDVFTLNLLGFKMTFVVGPEAQAVFFRASDEELSPREAYQFVVPVFGKGVVYDSPTEVMYEQLKFIRSSLVVSQLRRAVGIMAEEAEAFFDKRWGESGEADMLLDMNKLTILTASRCLMGDDIRRTLGLQEHFANLYHDLESGLNPLGFFFPNLPFVFRKRDQAREAVSKIFRKVLVDRRANPAPEHVDEEKQDIMSVLMSCKYKDGSSLTDEHIVGMMIGLLFAGQHTSSITATWTAFMLLDPKNKRFLDGVLEDIKCVDREFGGLVNFDSVRKSQFLENCVRETLRLFPPLIMLMRKVKQTMQYKDTIIPEGDLLCVSPAVGMRLDSVYKEPNTFDPTRFDRNEHNAQPFSYLAFGGGKHGCPGENFGLLQVKTIWTVLLRKYDLEMVNPTPKPDLSTLVVGPEPAACRIRYRRKVGK